MNRDGPSPYEPFDLLLGYKNNGLLRIGWLQKNGYKKKKRGYKTIEREWLQNHSDTWVQSAGPRASMDIQSRMKEPTVMCIGHSSVP
jgi:hypothetical protein